MLVPSRAGEEAESIVERISAPDDARTQNDRRLTIVLARAAEITGLQRELAVCRYPCGAGYAQPGAGSAGIPGSPKPSTLSRVPPCPTDGPFVASPPLDLRDLLVDLDQLCGPRPLLHAELARTYPPATIGPGHLAFDP